MQALARKDVRFQRDHRGVELPIDGLAPQPILPVADEFRCLFCQYLTVSRAKVRLHANMLRMMVSTEVRHVCSGFFYESVCAGSFSLQRLHFFVDICYNSRVVYIS